MPKVPKRIRLKISIRGIAKILKQPEYFMLMLLLFALILLVLQWFFNLELLRFVLSTPALSIGERIEFILSGYANLFISFNDLRPISLVLISFFQGAALSVFVFLYRHDKNFEAANKQSRSIFAGLIGSGCAACGGSILAPLLSGFSSTTATAISMIAGEIILLLALGLALYSLLGMGRRVELVFYRGKKSG